MDADAVAFLEAIGVEASYDLANDGFGLLGGDGARWIAHIDVDLRMSVLLQFGENIAGIGSIIPACPNHVTGRRRSRRGDLLSGYQLLSLRGRPY